LLDVNLLVALFDEEHVHHDRAQAWWAHNTAFGWASCPLTQNGFLRVMSQPNYPNPISIAFAANLLTEQIAMTDHVQWPNDISLLDEELFIRTHMLGPRQLTDIYLLGLAVRNNGRLATFDSAISISAVRGAEARHLVMV
jgi:toxin-antitoxin system PIN domain toxin